MRVSIRLMAPGRIVAIGPLLVLGACVSTPRDSREWGHHLALANCAVCHAVGSQGGSPNAFAPAFRDLHRIYSFQNIDEENFARGQINGHPPMPSFSIRPEDLRDLFGYIRSIQPSPSGP